MHVYLDHAATTTLRPEVRDLVTRVAAERWGNPSSLHRWGRESRAALEDARARVAAVIGAAPGEIVFTRGGTEADNLAILGRVGADSTGGIACSAVEHSAVLGAARSAAEQGRALRELPVDGSGVIRMDALRAALAERPMLVSVMWANNEVGTVQPLADVAEACRSAGVPLHSDAVQALGKLAVRVDRVPVGLASFSAHKIGGPRGIGALFVRSGIALAPLMFGGGQERGMRPGTEDVAAAAGFALAIELTEAERDAECVRLGTLRDELEARLAARLPGLVVHGVAGERLPTVSNVSIPGIDASILLMALDLEGVAASSGSACSSGATKPSHVLTAMGVAPEVARSSIRLSLGRDTTAEEVAWAAETIPAVAERLRALGSGSW